MREMRRENSQFIVCLSMSVEGPQFDEMGERDRHMDPRKYISHLGLFRERDRQTDGHMGVTE